MNIIKINTEYIKLDALLKYSGIADTGGYAKILITEGKVYVNGDICTMRGKKIFSGDRIRCENTEVLVEDGN